MAVRATRDLGLRLLGAWLIVTAVIGFVPLALPGLGLVLSLLAFAAGLLILIGR